MLADLTQKRDHLVDFIDAHLALVSPARRLPDDVVREIFEASLPSEYAVMRGDEPPLLLRQICQPWRRLAQSTPRLWATLHVAASPSDKMEKMRDAVNVWIARSGSVPLSLSFLARRFDSDCDISSVLKTFVGVAYRWKDIRLVVSEGHLGPLAVLSPHDVPMLQRAVVKGAAARKFLSFMGAPTLRSVALMAQETTFHSLPLHWHTLVHLSIEGYIEVREALALLRQSPRLETCNLHVQSVEGPVSPIPCHLEHLSQLCLDDWSLVGASLFRALVLPSLRRLEYTCQFVVKGHSLPFLNLLYPDNCLECLSLNIGQLPEESVLEALCLVPMLQELCMVQNTVERVDRMRVANEPLSIVALLTSGSLESTDMLCPTLRSIRLLHTRVSDIELLAFIRSRTGPHLMNNHLSRVHVEFYDRPMQVDIMPSLLALIDNCLDVSLRYNYSPPPVIRYSPSDQNQSPDAEWAPFSTTWSAGRRW
ncbi:hypothetical protein B0H10DRAFT_2441483 [Mycena sp. CBHHK59/15]|nr:hypothetical protein B0H10DRAFT_2441483 [Mycena sp. CBHHK59/15]